MYSNKTQYDTNQELGSYIDAHLTPENEAIDTTAKNTKYEESPDLELYLEALLETDEQDVATEVKVEQNELDDIDTSEKKLKISEQQPTPLWEQKIFQCLLVNLAGMKVLVPAMSISYIERIDKKIIRLPMGVDAFRGMVTLRNRSVAVIDLFSLVSENTYLDGEQPEQTDEQNIDYVIVIDKSDYALACEDIGEMITLKSSDVCWHEASFNNPMFSGIVPDYLCPLVNMDNLNKQIVSMPFVQSANNSY